MMEFMVVMGVSYVVGLIVPQCISYFSELSCLVENVFFSDF